MDVKMPKLNGIEATRRIKKDFPDTIIVALSIHSDVEFVQQMLQAGYILKESVPEELVKGIRCVMLGDGYLSPAITGVVVSQLRKSALFGEVLDEVNVEILQVKYHVLQLPNNYVRR